MPSLRDWEMFFGNCSATAILSLTGQSPDYSQIPNFALKSMECASLLAPSKAVASYRTPKKFAAQEQKKGLDEFVNKAGKMSRQGQDIYSIRNSRKPPQSPVRDEIYTANT